MDRSITSSELSFHGLPSKSKRSSKETENRQYRRYYQLKVLLFLRNSHLQRDIQQTFFRQFLYELFENFCSASKYVSKTLRTFNKKKKQQKKETKKTRPWRKVFAKFTGKRLCQRLYFNKVTGLMLEKRDSGTSVFSRIQRNFLEHLFYRTPPDDCFCFQLLLSEQPLEVLYEKRYSSKFCKIHKKTPVVNKIFKSTSERLFLAFPCNFTKTGDCQQCFENLR